MEAPLDDLEACASLAPDPKARDWRGTSFTAWCDAIGVELLPGQRALTMVAYDGLEPSDLPPELRELARRIFGDIDVIPAEARRVVCVVAGARAGKSYVIGALRLLHLALTVDLSSLAPGQEAYGVIFAGDPRQRRECFSYVLGAARSHPAIRSMILGKARDDDDFAGSEFTLKRPDGKVTLESLPPKPGGGSGRGRSLVGALLEECAFFQDENHIVNDVDVFKAVTPRVLPGGQTILSSTPWAEAGLLYEEFTANHPDPRCAAPHLTAKGSPHRAIAAHAPTLLLRDVPLTRNIVAAETARDPSNAAREYGAQFLSLTATQFFDAISIAQAVDESLKLGAPRPPHSIVCVGSDLGFVRDAAAGVACARTAQGYAVLDYLEIMPTADRLKPSEVFGRIAGLARAYGADEVVADAVYSESARESLDVGGVVLIATPGGNAGKSEVYSAVRHELHEGNMRLPNDPKLLQQLREVKKRPTPGGGYVIEQPRTAKGGHGDVVSALVAGVWRLSRLRLPEIPEVLPPGRETDAVLWQRREEARIEQGNHSDFDRRELSHVDDTW